MGTDERRTRHYASRPHAPGSPLRGPPRDPEALAALPEVATNLHWTWDAEATRLFGRLWPGWTAGAAHPAEMVRTTSAERLAELAADPGIIDDLGAVYRRLQTALKGTSWFRPRAGSPLRTVAYFSPEFGITEAAAAVLRRPRRARRRPPEGVLRPRRAARRRRPALHRGLLPPAPRRRRLAAGERRRVRPRGRSAWSTPGVEVTVDLAGDPVRAHVWRADVGRIPLYLLDTDVEGNSPDGVAVTDRLYGGDEHHRLRQEIVLGIGGVRALRALGIAPDVFHMQRGPRRLPRPRAGPRARRRRPAVRRRRRGGAAAAACSRPTRPSPPASTASRGR